MVIWFLSSKVWIKKGEKKDKKVKFDIFSESYVKNGKVSLSGGGGWVFYSQGRPPV